jgi:hypothetical protein
MALEIANVVHAIGLVGFDDVVGVPTPALRAGVGFQAAIVRAAAGAYQMSTEISADYGEVMCVVSVPAPLQGNARMGADGVVDIVVLFEGLPVDPAEFTVVVFRFRSGTTPIPNLPPFAAAGLITNFNVRTPANGGNDVTGVGSAALPFASPTRALAVLGNRPGIIHMGTGTYTRPLLAGLDGPLVFVGDGGGDVLDDALVEVVAPQAAAGGTGAGIVVGAGLGAAVVRRDSIEMLDGAAIGQRRTIAAIDGGTDIIPARNFSPAPAPGDSFRIVRSAVLWNAFTDNETWIQNCGSLTRGLAGLSVTIPVTGFLRAVYLANIGLDGAPGTTLRIVDALVVAHGLDQTDNIAVVAFENAGIFSGCDSDIGTAVQIAALLGQASASLWAGYGYAAGAAFLGLGIDGGFFGYSVTPSGLLADSLTEIRLLGGTSGRVAVQTGAELRLQSTAAPRLRITATGADNAISGNGMAAVSSNQITAGVSIVADAGDAVRLRAGSQARLEGGLAVTSVTGNACNCSQGGQAYIEGSPAATWAGGGADFRVSATETLAAAGFAAVDVTLAAAVANGALVTRVS